MQLNEIQNKVINLPFKNSKVILQGSCGCGKTQTLIKRYTHMVNSGVNSDSILTLVINRAQSLMWRDKLVLEKSEAVNRSSYFGFVQNEIRLFWPYILEKCTYIKRKDLVPIFMTFEAAQCIMLKLVKKYRDKDGIVTINAVDDRIAIELVNNLSKAAIGGIDSHEIGSRLYNTIEIKEMADKSVYLGIDIIMQEFREMCLKRGVLDYSLTVELYNKYLFTDERYIKNLRKRFRHVIIDNVEEAVPVQVDLINFFIDNCDTVLLGFSDDGGFANYFGANITYVKRRLLNRCEHIKLSDYYTCSKEFFEFSDYTYKCILDSKGQKYDNKVNVKKAHYSDFRSDMLEKVSNNIIKLIDEGIRPNEIAIIAPIADVTTEYALNNKLNEKGYTVKNLIRRRRAIDNPFVQALTVFACMAHPWFDILPAYNDIVSVIRLVLNIDPIRSSLIASEIVKNKPYTFPTLESMNLRERVGFFNADKYEYIRDWTLKYINAEKDSQIKTRIDEFFRRVYLEILSHIEVSEENLKKCLQLIDTASTFVDVIDMFNDEKEIINPDAQFVSIILKGSKAAESIQQLEENINHDTIILTTPSAYLMTCKNTKVQMWVDVESDAWMPRTIKDLTNPYVLTKTWDKNDIYTNDLEWMNRVNGLAMVVKCLIRRCKDKIILYESNYNGVGFEEDGLFSNVMSKIL